MTFEIVRIVNRIITGIAASEVVQRHVLLTYEQSLVSDDDLSQVKRAFDLNGYVGIVYFVATAVSLYLR